MITKEDLAQSILRLEASSIELKNSHLRLEASQEKTDAQMKITGERLAEMLISQKKVGKMVGGIANNQGDIAEEFFITQSNQTLH